LSESKAILYIDKEDDG